MFSLSLNDPWILETLNVFALYKVVQLKRFWTFWTGSLGLFYEVGMPLPMGGVERGGRRRLLSFSDMAAISGSWVSYIFTSRANLRTPEGQNAEVENDSFLLAFARFACSISPSPSLLKPYALMTSCWIWVATGSTSCSILPMSLQALSLASSMRAAFSGMEKAWITSLRTTAMDERDNSLAERSSR